MLKNKYLVFDLGGVFIRLTGVDTMLKWTGNLYSENELWELWINSSTVKSFETGKTSPETFATGMISEFSLPVSQDLFLKSFSSWSNELFPGAKRLMSELSGQFHTACLSNTNIIHWKNLCDKSFDQYFEHIFVSHEIGLIKPDPQIYEHLIKSLGCSPEDIFFFDDNIDNIQSAVDFGIQAYQVCGLNQLQSKLKTIIEF